MKHPNHLMRGISTALIFSISIPSAAFAQTANPDGGVLAPVGSPVQSQALTSPPGTQPPPPQTLADAQAALAQAQAQIAAQNAALAAAQAQIQAQQPAPGTQPEAAPVSQPAGPPPQTSPAYPAGGYQPQSYPVNPLNGALQVTPQQMPGASGKDPYFLMRNLSVPVSQEYMLSDLSNTCTQYMNQLGWSGATANREYDELYAGNGYHSNRHVADIGEDAAIGGAIGFGAGLILGPGAILGGILGAGIGAAVGAFQSFFHIFSKNPAADAAKDPSRDLQNQTEEQGRQQRMNCIISFQQKTLGQNNPDTTQNPMVNGAQNRDGGLPIAPAGTVPGGAPAPANAPANYDGGAG